MFDRVTNDVLCDKVIIDDQMAAYEAVDFLVSKGFKKIALVTTVDYVSVGKLRTDGYVNALNDHDLPIDEDMIVKIEDIANCASKIEKLLKENKPDAIFAVNELFAVTSIKLATKMGIKVPEELSIIGFTDGIISQFSTPSITTVSQNGIKMGGRAAKLLIERLEMEEVEEENEQYRTELIETHLVLRESTSTL
jgi:LacI family transcriptional regulator